MIPARLRPYRKAVTASAAFLGVLVAQGALSGDAAAYATAVLAVLGSWGVYQVPNEEQEH